MGISISTARYLAPSAFLIDFAAQNYGMLSTPSMLDVHNANLSFFSPQPYFIAGFFFPQQLAQVAWLWRLWRLDAAKPAERRELEIMADYAPYYAVGNLCIACMLRRLFRLLAGCGPQPPHGYTRPLRSKSSANFSSQHGCSSGTPQSSKPPTSL